MRTVHPDKHGGDPAAARLAVLANEAKDVLLAGGGAEVRPPRPPWDEAERPTEDWDGDSRSYDSGRPWDEAPEEPERPARGGDEEAVCRFRLAAEQGDARAQASLGLMYEEGRGVVRDDGEAVRWYRLAAGAGLCPLHLNDTSARRRCAAKPPSRAAALCPTLSGGEGEKITTVGVLTMGESSGRTNAG